MDLCRGLGSPCEWRDLCVKQVQNSVKWHRNQSNFRNLIRSRACHRPAVPPALDLPNDDWGSVKLRVRLLNSFVLSFKTTVFPARALPREDFQTFSARRRICGSVSASGMSSGKVSSAEMDLLIRF